MAGNRIIIGSEGNDDRHIELDKNVNTNKITVPVTMYDSNGNVVSPATSGSTSFGNGSATITTAGTRIQLPSQACKSILIQSHESNGNLTNGGAVVIGGSTVVASLSTRSGYAIYPTQSQSFNISNLNQIYIDSVDNNAIVTYTWEQ